MKFSKTDLEAFLKRAGWYPGRNIRNQLEHYKLAQLYPEKVFSVFCEFGGLEKITDGLSQESIDFSKTKDLFESEDVYKRLAKRQYEQGMTIDVEYGQENNIYYFSVLLGTTLYGICTIRDGNVLLMDAGANCYIIDGINNLQWVGSDIWDAMSYLIFNDGDYVPFWEDTIEWGYNEEQKQKGFNLPVNTLLGGKNPF